MSQAKDPVCGKMIETRDAAARTTYESHEVHFCSEECHRAFEAAPEQYERHEPPFTVKGGLTAPKFGSAASGGLEHEPGARAAWGGAPAQEVREREGSGLDRPQRTGDQDAR